MSYKMCCNKYSFHLPFTKCEQVCTRTSTDKKLRDMIEAALE